MSLCTYFAFIPAIHYVTCKLIALCLWSRTRRIWKCVIGSWQRLRAAYFYRCLVVSLSHRTYTSGSFALVRVTSSSLAFSLRELEIELYTLTQPSGYAIRRYLPTFRSWSYRKPWQLYAKLTAMQIDRTIYHLFLRIFFLPSNRPILQTKFNFTTNNTLNIVQWNFCEE